MEKGKGGISLTWRQPADCAVSGNCEETSCVPFSIFRFICHCLLLVTCLPVYQRKPLCDMISLGPIQLAFLFSINSIRRPTSQR